MSRLSSRVLAAVTNTAFVKTPGRRHRGQIDPRPMVGSGVRSSGGGHGPLHTTHTGPRVHAGSPRSTPSSTLAPRVQCVTLVRDLGARGLTEEHGGGDEVPRPWVVQQPRDACCAQAVPDEARPRAGVPVAVQHLLDGCRGVVDRRRGRRAPDNAHRDVRPLDQVDVPVPRERLQELGVVDKPHADPVHEHDRHAPGAAAPALCRGVPDAAAVLDVDGDASVDPAAEAAVEPEVACPEEARARHGAGDDVRDQGPVVDAQVVEYRTL